MSVSIMAPVLALRGPDGSLHDAILGMQKWTSFVIVIFLVSLVLYAASVPILAITCCGREAWHSTP